jgi:hypothetical protein
MVKTTKNELITTAARRLVARVERLAFITTCYTEGLQS